MRKIILLLAILLVGCVPKGDIRPVSFDGVQIINVDITGVDIEVKVTLDNSFKKPIKISEAAFDVVSGTKIIANVTLSSEVTIEPEKRMTYTIPLRARLNAGNINEAIKALRNPESLRFEGSVKGQMGGWKKRIKFNYPLSNRDIEQIRKSL